ncbi:MAG TPA: AAA family ATPase [Phycisphaerae bacterium]|nr:AAA family ATPase [Phycisphaerae bacterium]
MADLIEDLKLLIRTRHPLVTVRTMEESYAARQIREAGRDLGLPVLEWSISDRLRRTVPAPTDGSAQTDTLLGALRFMRGNKSVNVYILKDAMQHLREPVIERTLRETALEYSRDSRTIFMIDPAGKLPDSLRTLTVPYELALPDEKEIRKIVKRTFRQVGPTTSAVVDMTREEYARFVASLRGLTRMEISQVVVDAVLGSGKLCADDAARAAEVKRRRLRQTGVLDYLPPPEAAPKVGGMATLRKWLRRRSRAFSPEAVAFGLAPPRGILMLGVQGCGKSLMARFVAAEWKMPLLRMDVGSLYDKYVGESERHLRQAFEVAAAMAPCVLWIDEVEKAFASAAAGAGSAVSDGGLSQRLFGQLLTWMQDHPEPVFLVATANDVSALPPELLRKGRFDEVFFVDLPGAEARKEIFRIHLAKRKRDPKGFDLDALVAASEGFSGAEIEQAVVAAMYAAFNEDRDLTTDDLRDELAATRPLSVVMAEKVATLRAWADGRCVRAD